MNIHDRNSDCSEFHLSIQNQSDGKKQQPDNGKGKGLDEKEK